MSENSSKTTIYRKLLFRLVSAYPECKITDLGIDAYIDILQEYDQECIALSMRECIRKLKFFPKVAEIIENAQPFLKRKTLVITDSRFNDADFMREQDKINRGAKSK